MPRTREELFKLVQNPDHWKDPIYATIPEVEFDDFNDAVQYYTSTSLEKVNVPDADGMVRVHSVGYWGGPAAGG